MLRHHILGKHRFKELGGFWVSGHEFSNLYVRHCLDFNSATFDLPRLSVCISDEVDLNFIILFLLGASGRLFNGFFDNLGDWGYRRQSCGCVYELNLYLPFHWHRVMLGIPRY